MPNNTDNTDKTPGPFHIIMTGAQIHAELARQIEWHMETIARAKVLAAAAGGEGVVYRFQEERVLALEISNCQRLGSFIAADAVFRLEREDLAALGFFRYGARSDGSIL